ncbi:MAG: DUF1778 domain-containing protein [Ilumatobacteraceae bacterium]
MAHTRNGRLNLRVTGDQERPLRLAAALTGQTISEFVLSAAVAYAHHLVDHANHIGLSASQFTQFVAELDEPAETVPELVQLFDRPSRITQG